MVSDYGRPFLLENFSSFATAKTAEVAVDRMHSVSHGLYFNVLDNGQHRSIIQTAEYAIVRFALCFGVRFRFFGRPSPPSTRILLLSDARSRRATKKGGGVVNNVMKFLRRFETRQRHLRRDFMKSLNSPGAEGYY